MNEKERILKELDDAIDRADLREIDRGLHALSGLGHSPVQPEDPRLFSARVQKMYREQCRMSKPRKAVRIAVIAAAVMAMGLTVYAAGAMNFFSFLSGDRFVTMRTTEDMTQEEAQALVEDTENAGVPDGAATAAPEVRELSFDTVRQAEKELEMPLPLPASLPDMALESADAQVAAWGENVETRTCWLNYVDDRGRMLGVTVTREIVRPGTPVTGYETRDMDDGSLGSYKSRSGVEYTTMTESDDAGERTAHIACTRVGAYEYALVFIGFEEAERREMIDSTDLSVYGEKGA